MRRRRAGLPNTGAATEELPHAFGPGRSDRVLDRRLPLTRRMNRADGSRRPAGVATGRVPCAIRRRRLRRAVGSLMRWENPTAAAEGERQQGDGRPGPRIAPLPPRLDVQPVRYNGVCCRPARVCIDGLERQAAGGVWVRRSGSWVGPLALTGAGAIWGGMYVISAVVLRVVPPWVLLEMRLVLGTAVLLLLLTLHPPTRIAPRDWALLAVLGLVGFTGSVGLQFVGTALAGAATGSLITAASPGLIALLAVPVLHERLTAGHVLAMGLGLAGIVAVVGLNHGSNSAAGDLALAGAAILWAVYTVLSRLATRRHGSLTVTAFASLFGAVFTLPLAMVQARGLAFARLDSVGLWLGIGYLGLVSTAGAFYLWNQGFEHLPARVGGLYLLVQPLVGGALGWLWLGESLGVGFGVGALLIVSAVIVASRVSASPPALANRGSG